MAHSGLPRPKPLTLGKAELLETLRQVDQPGANQRVLAMETDFRTRIAGHIDSLPGLHEGLRRFNTSPFVVLFYAMQRGFTKISQVEEGILPAKLFSSMETSAGRMVEKVTLPIYGWECVESSMHTAESALDGRKLEGDTLRLVTLKSGPRCLNDEMSENFADAIVGNYEEWARSAGVKEIEFTYGVLYGTRKQSNKKDWHILRKIREKLPAGALTVDPDGRWSCEFAQNGITVSVTVRIGIDWWLHLGGETGLVEVAAALIRACIAPGDADPEAFQYTIADLGDVVSTSQMPDDYNVSTLQRSQIPWLYFFAYHFCDELIANRSEQSNSRAN